jgi:hypothetical protein
VLHNKGNMVFTAGFDANTVFGGASVIGEGDIITALLSAHIDGDDTRDILMMMQPPAPDAPFLFALFAVATVQPGAVYLYSPFGVDTNIIFSWGSTHNPACRCTQWARSCSRTHPIAAS